MAPSACAEGSEEGRILLAPSAWPCFSWQQGSLHSSEAFLKADGNQAALALSGSARSLKSPALSPHWLLSLCGAGAGGWLCSFPAAAGPRAGPPGHILPLTLLCGFGVPLHAFGIPPPCSWGPCPTGTLITPQTLRGCLVPTPQCCSHSDPTWKESHRYALMENKENNVLGQARRSMAKTSGEVFSFPLPGTGDAAMAGLGLPSSRVIRRSRGVQWRVTKTVIPGAQGRWEELDGVTGDTGVRGDLTAPAEDRPKHFSGCQTLQHRARTTSSDRTLRKATSPKDGADLGEGWWSSTLGADQAEFHGCLELMLVAAPVQMGVGHETPDPPSPALLALYCL